MFSVGEAVVGEEDDEGVIGEVRALPSYAENGRASGPSWSPRRSRAPSYGGSAPAKVVVAPVTGGKGSGPP